MDVDPIPTPPVGGPDKSSTGLEPNIAAGLAVLFGWVGGLIFFLIEKDSKFVKFWAMQAICIGVLGMALGFIPFVNIVAGIILLVLWIMCLVNAFQGKMWRIPGLGAFAAKQAGLD